MSLSVMQEASKLQNALRGEDPTFGAWQTLPGSNVSRIMAGTGLDWICVDTEHGNNDDGQMHEAVAAIAGTGASPVVRIAANEGWMVKRALDAGAHGIVVPLLNTAEEARKLVAAAKFPPAGIRGFGSPFTQGRFHPSLTAFDYLHQANDALVTIVQIETKDALANVEEIAAVEGVDVLFVGPFDLGISIGHPLSAAGIPKELQKAIDEIQQAAKQYGKRTGIYCVSGEQSREFAQKGFNMISIAADAHALTINIGQSLIAATKKA